MQEIFTEWKRFFRVLPFASPLYLVLVPHLRGLELNTGNYLFTTDTK